MKASQGKLSISEFAHKLEFHWLSLTDKSDVSEHAIANIFMHGLNPGPPRTELFRKKPNDMADALKIALGEQYSQSARHFRVPRTLTIWRSAKLAWRTTDAKLATLIVNATTQVKDAMCVVTIVNERDTFPATAPLPADRLPMRTVRLECIRVAG
ncbi:unnamed protein product [Aphanomyces euteiches]|uniref:Retrotransposon gag domain-containing protein n=1 Tax=Aphanomyces euteiches TaxID=100861 RepID=A0A6G0WFA3_9STRA|nr:hypothetical protein Ae201684_016342 [Aphanomyces euteiches]KAH9079894.1 hypothetical protein Ae201684P_007603 [Aphanomyces euteiches]